MYFFVYWTGQICKNLNIYPAHSWMLAYLYLGQKLNYQQTLCSRDFSTNTFVTHSFITWSFSTKPSKHHYNPTVRARELAFGENVHPPPRVTCHVSGVRCHVSGVMSQVSVVRCHVSGVTCVLFCFFFLGGGGGVTPKQIRPLRPPPPRKKDVWNFWLVYNFVTLDTVL